MHSTPFDGLQSRPRAIATAVIVTGTFMAVLDSTIANLALPSLMHAFAVDASSSIWIINAYQLAIVAVLLPCAALGDRLGYKQVYITGLTLFTLGSLGCALAHTLPLLIAARVFQGLGSGGILSIGPALYRTIYPQHLLGRGLGISALTVAISSAAGPALGGVILNFLPWPWLFALNVPIGFANVLIAPHALPPTPHNDAALDLGSVVSSALGLIAVVLGIDGLHEQSIIAPA